MYGSFRLILHSVSSATIIIIFVFSGMHLFQTNLNADLMIYAERFQLRLQMVKILVDVCHSGLDGLTLPPANQKREFCHRSPARLESVDNAISETLYQFIAHFLQFSSVFEKSV